MLGGALGNIVDRVRYGYVVDFADLHFGEWRPFLIFNVGDAAITIGVLLLLSPGAADARPEGSPGGKVTMRIVKLGLAAAAAPAAGRLRRGGIAGRERPDEFAVARTAPLVIPPDFALTPPATRRAGAGGADSRTQALEALFGGPAPRSETERQMLSQADADRAALGARSVVGDPRHVVVDKGAVTQTIVAAPAGAGQEATVSTPQ